MSEFYRDRDLGDENEAPQSNTSDRDLADLLLKDDDFLEQLSISARVVGQADVLPEGMVSAHRAVLDYWRRMTGSDFIKK